MSNINLTIVTVEHAVTMIFIHMQVYSDYHNMKVHEDTDNKHNTNFKNTQFDAQRRQLATDYQSYRYEHMTLFHED